MNPMTLQKHPYGAFLGLALLLFPLTLVVAGLVLQSWDHLQYFGEAFASNAQRPVVVVGITIYFLGPFLLLGVMCASLAKRKGSRAAMVLLAFGAVLLGLTCILGFQDSLTAKARHAWTVMALSTGLIPFFSLPALLSCACLRWYFLRRSGLSR